MAKPATIPQLKYLAGLKRNPHLRTRYYALLSDLGLEDGDPLTLRQAMFLIDGLVKEEQWQKGKGQAMAPQAASGSPAASSELITTAQIEAIKDCLKLGRKAASIYQSFVARVRGQGVKMSSLTRKEGEAVLTELLSVNGKRVKKPVKEGKRASPAVVERRRALKEYLQGRQRPKTFLEL